MLKKSVLRLFHPLFRRRLKKPRASVRRIGVEKRNHEKAGHGKAALEKKRGWKNQKTPGMNSCSFARGFLSSFFSPKNSRLASAFFRSMHES